MNNLSNVVALEELMVFDRIEIFIKSKYERSNSHDTETSYKNDIKSFYSWKVEHINDYDDLIKLTVHDIELNDTDILKYRTYLLSDIKNSANTVNRKIGTLKLLYEYFESVDLTYGLKAFINVGKVKGKDNSYGAFQPHEVFEIAEYLRNKPITRGRKLNLTKSNLVLFATQTGLRLESILKLKLKDFIKDSHDVIVYAVDKGNELKKCKIDFKLYNDLLVMYESEGKGKEYMFNISTNSVNNMMDEIRNHFKFPEHRNLKFHSFRKTGATHVYKMTGSDLLKTQHFTGHKDLNMLRRYILQEEDQIDYGLITTSRGINKELYKEVPYEKLVEGISQLSDSEILMLNTILSKM